MKTTREREFDRYVETREHWMRAAFKRFLVNKDGAVYGTVYDAQLNDIQKSIIRYGIDGTLQRDVWNQVYFE